MTAQIIDGTAIAAAVRAEVAERVASFVASGHRAPHLSVVLVGDDPASHTYVGMKGEAAVEVGMTSDTLLMPATATFEEIMATVARLNADPNVSGILVQSPLPSGIDEPAVMSSIRVEKDVDGLTPASLGRLVQGEPVMVPCTPAGVQQMLVRSGFDPAGKNVVVVGRSMLVGKPVALLLGLRAAGANATVTIAHTGTRDLAAVTREAEILIVAAGRPNTVTADMIRPGAVVIDVGTNRVEAPERKSGFKLTGDVEFEAAKEVASAISPVPGGVGPMTIAMLLSNTLKAAEIQAGTA
ncbi:MAG: bifunctional 5,10-methylenetetrahydrofolate dehydrogenase/5,10-methenyltetrahydrofolate cyclohydrolase [Chloroflexi bacterium]|nr:MAG: bifunctional 5,10-methylenetetrahydrofolate dehydrogenase/5,10-methenyltetrahydrofolate cyclohydrolase [Chloroflexota bacterium]